MSKIEWTEQTWNPVTGCSVVSAGCKHCYAERMAKRLQKIGLEKYRNGFEVTLHEQTLNDPFKWRKPQLVFVNSMSDLFHEKIPLAFIQKVFYTMNNTPHVYQVLTKRSERLAELAKHLTWSDNIWMGVSVESKAYRTRIDDLRRVPAAIRFLSCEPLIKSLGKLNLANIHWVIVGGESGPGARPMKPEWVSEIKVQCLNDSVPFFFKQWGGVNKAKTGRMFEGRTWDEYPKEFNLQNIGKGSGNGQNGKQNKHRESSSVRLPAIEVV